MTPTSAPTTKRIRELDDDLTYTANLLDRDVMNRDQWRLVIRTFRDRRGERGLNSFPRAPAPFRNSTSPRNRVLSPFSGRSGVDAPKTLVFAKTDLHADDIVQVIREEFGKGNEFCQKITSKTTGKKPEVLHSESGCTFLRPQFPIPDSRLPTQCLLFMRNINPASYFEQMKGRGCRIVSSDDLQGVTRASWLFPTVPRMRSCCSARSTI